MPLDVPGLRAAYRTDPGMHWDEVEQYFAISLASASSERLEATVVAPIGGTITRQLLSQFHRDVKASFESILVQVSVRRFTVDSVACPAIDSRMSTLSKLNVSLQDDGLLRVDHTKHRIAVWWSAGEIDARMDDAGHPLVRWAAETHNALMACGRMSGVEFPQKSAAGQN
jgi:hypothetical protein